MTAEYTIEPRTAPAPAFTIARPGGRDMLAAARCAGILAAGAREAAREWARFAQARGRGALEGLAALMLCRSPADYIAAQADLACEHLDLVRGASGRLSEIVGEAAGEAVRALSAPGPEG